MGQNCSVISVRRGLPDKELENITFVRLTRKTVQAGTSRDAGRGNCLWSRPQALSTPQLAINPEQNEACLQPLIDLTPLPPAPHLQLGKSDPTELGRTLWGLIPISGPLLSLVNHYTSNATALSCTNLHSYALGGWNPWNGMLPC